MPHDTEIRSFLHSGIRLPLLQNKPTTDHGDGVHGKDIG